MARRKPHYRLSVTVLEVRGEMCTARLFSQGVDLLVVKFLPRQEIVPINHYWHQKPRDTELDRILLRSLVLTQYRSVTDGRTDGRICRSMYSACQTTFAASCKNHAYWSNLDQKIDFLQR